MDEELPLEVPDTLPQLDQAIMLLGNLAQAGTLRPSRRAQLVKLVGACPSQEQAGVWKQALKGLREEMGQLDAMGRSRRVEDYPTESGGRGVLEMTLRSRRIRALAKEH